MNAPYHERRLIEWCSTERGRWRWCSRLARGASFRPRRPLRPRHPRCLASLRNTRAIPRKTATGSRASAKITKVPAQLIPKCFQCSVAVVQQITYLWYIKYHIRFKKPSRPICSNTVDLFKFPIDGLEGSTTSYMVFDVLRNSFHVCRKQTEVWKTKDTREALEWYCLLRCSWWQVEQSL